jgi:hypothetical protein
LAGQLAGDRGLEHGATIGFQPLTRLLQLLLAGFDLAEQLIDFCHDAALFGGRRHRNNRAFQVLSRNTLLADRTCHTALCVVAKSSLRQEVKDISRVNIWCGAEHVEFGAAKSNA